MNIFHKTQKKETRKLPMTGKVKKGFRYYCMACCGFERDRCFCDVYNGFCRKRSAYRCE